MVSEPRSPGSARTGRLDRSLATFLRQGAALVLFFLPLWTLSNRAAGLRGAQDRGVAGDLSRTLTGLASQQGIFWSDERRFATREELRARQYWADDLEVYGGGNLRNQSTVTILEERLTDDAYTISAVVDEAPWVRATATITAPDLRIERSTSLDWIDSASRLDALDYAVAILGCLSALATSLLWNRRPRWRWAFGTLAAFVLLNWIWSLRFRPLLPVFDRLGPALGDSAWIWL